MSVVVISPYSVVNLPEVGGHFWVYLQYADGLRRLGCEVYWLESFLSTGDANEDSRCLSDFFREVSRYGLDGKVLLYSSREGARHGDPPFEYLGVSQSHAESVFRRADLLLNFHYGIEPALLARFRRTALVDIDPGLLQFWMSAGQIVVPPHDFYFTTGETVGTAAAKFPDCHLNWIHIHPPVSLEFWPYMADPLCETFTTVATWWGDGEWITDGDSFYDNNKRVSFLEFATLPRKTPQSLELALCMGEGDEDDRRLLESHGWRVRHSVEVSGTPRMYQSYIQGSRGEFSCAKPSCAKFQNAWISDRTACYLASGKPVVVQDTGPSCFLPNGKGMFRFSTMEEAVDAFAAINADYQRHCRAARELAEAYFDAKQVAEKILSVAV